MATAINDHIGIFESCQDIKSSLTPQGQNYNCMAMDVISKYYNNYYNKQ